MTQFLLFVGNAVECNDFHIFTILGGGAIVVRSHIGGILAILKLDIRLGRQLMAKFHINGRINTL